MNSGPILDSPWPRDLDPAAVPFKRRTETVLRRAGYHDAPRRFDSLTEAEVMGWWNHEETDVRSARNVVLAAVAAHTGLNGRDPIDGRTVARMLGLSPARMCQIQGALERHRLRARPPEGTWMPQVRMADLYGWPDEHTGAFPDLPAVSSVCQVPVWCPSELWIGQQRVSVLGRV